MKLYRLHIHPGEADGEGENHDEWFTSFVDALARREALIRETPDDGYKYGTDYGIEAITFADLTPKKLLLAVLNREGYVASRHTMMRPYKPNKTNREGV